MSTPGAVVPSAPSDQHADGSVPAWAAWRVGRWLLVFGLAGMALLTLLVVVGQATTACRSLTQGIDDAVTAWAVAHRRPVLTPGAWLVTHLGGTAGLTMLTALVAAVLAWRDRATCQAADRWRRAVTLVVTMLGASVSIHLAKLLIGRPRPAAALLLGEPASSFAFPSGHSAGTAAFAGTVALLVVVGPASSAAAAHPSATWGRSWRAAVVLAAAAGTTATGLSRIYLAYHWLTDVLAGWCLGLVWVGVAAWLVRRPTPRRCSAQDQDGSALATRLSHRPPPATTARHAPGAAEGWRP